MEKTYNILGISFENDFLILKFENQVVKLKLASISEKLARATEQERNDFTISPSGYGIHWRQLDEDLSVKGLLKASKLISTF